MECISTYFNRSRAKGDPVFDLNVPGNIGLGKAAEIAIQKMKVNTIRIIDT
jgi:hypothetical protein